MFLQFFSNRRNKEPKETIFIGNAIFRASTFFDFQTDKIAINGRV